jgi:phage repressor protein C with HTH and peptisase S24 domain
MRRDFRERQSGVFDPGELVLPDSGGHGARLRDIVTPCQRHFVTKFRPNHAMETIGGRIRRIREAKGISRGDLAKMAGLAYSSLSDLEAGKAKTTTVLHKIAAGLGVRVEWLETGKGAQDRPESPEDVDWADIKGVRQAASLGEGAVIDEYAETHKLKFRADSLRRQHLRPDSLAVLYGRGESMEPTIKDGDAILFDTSDTDLKDGGIYVIQYDGSLMAKRLIDLDGRWFISSDNATDPKWSRPKSVDSTKGFEVFGRVRWVGGWVK